MTNPVVSSILSADSLTRGVLSKYNLRKPVSCRYYAGGINDTYLVTTGAARYYLRLYKSGWRRKRDIEAEAEMLSYLARRGHPVSHPLRRKDKGYLTRVAAPEGTRWAVLFTEAPGEMPSYDTARIRKYGQIVSGIHADLDRKPIDDRRFHLDFTHLLDEPLHHIEPFLRHRQDDFEYLTHVADELRSGIEDLLPRKMPEYGCCHGDHHGGNVHEDGQGTMTVFDFDCYGYGWRAYDVAVFLWQLTHNFGWERAGKAKTTRRWNAFLDGYAQTRSLTEPELTAARFFVPIRQIWWLGLHMYFRGSGAWGYQEIDGFLDHHIGFIRQSIHNYRLR